MKSRRILKLALHLSCLNLFALAAAHGQQPYGNATSPASDSDGGPKWLGYRTLVECESWTRCDGSWVFQSHRSGVAFWSQDSGRANLHIREITDNTVIIDRTGPGAGFTAVYSGTLKDGIIQGEVIWTWPGHFPQPYHGHWLASADGAKLGALVAAHNPPPLLTIAGSWLANKALTECESATRCDGLWRFTDSVDGHADWTNQSATADLKVTRITATTVEIVRSNQMFPRVAALYSGTLKDGIVDGDVTWTFLDDNNRQAHGHWYASANRPALQAKLGTRITAPPPPPPPALAAPLTAAQHGFGSDGRLMLTPKPIRASGMAIDAAGNFIIADAGFPDNPKTHRILRVQAATGAISTVVSGGTKVSDDLGDPLTGGPSRLALDGGGNIYTLGRSGDTPELVRIAPNGEMTVPAGTTMFDLARITRPSGPPNFVHVFLTLVTSLMTDSTGNIYFAGQGVSQLNLKTHALTPIVGGVREPNGSTTKTPPEGKGIAQGDWKGQSIPATSLVLDVDTDSLTSLRTTDFALGAQGNVYLRTKTFSGACVARVELSQGAISCLPGTQGPDAIAATLAGELLILKQGKVFRYDAATSKLVPLASLPPEYHGGPLAVDRAGNLYALCDGYIQRFSTR